MKLQEIFNKPTKYNWSYKSRDNWEGLFAVGEVEYVVEIELEHEDETNKEVWQMIFGVKGSKTHQQRVGITGTGNEFQVFATVGKMFDDFVKSIKPTRVEFTAKEKSRQKLYDRFIRIAAKKYNFDVSTGKDSYGNRLYRMDKK